MLSVIIPSYGRPGLLRDALSSVAANSTKVREVIVLSPQSKGEYAEICSAFSARLTHFLPSAPPAPMNRGRRRGGGWLALSRYGKAEPFRTASGEAADRSSVPEHGQAWLPAGPEPQM